MHKNIVKMFAIAVAGLVASDALAAYITYETRHTNNGVNTSDYLASWNQQTSTVNTSSLPNFNSRRVGSRNSHSHLQVEFTTNLIQDLVFEFAPDAGLGGAIYVNNDLVQRRAADLWWGYNWNRTNEILSSNGTDFSMGTNVIDLYWAERCCDGRQSGRFSLNGGQDWMSLSVANLASMPVPEPGILVLIAGGMVGLGLARRRKNA
ncbi:MAG: CCXG family PEP-CTERM protein [Gammaproteobacteria bacterium]